MTFPEEENTMKFNRHNLFFSRVIQKLVLSVLLLGLSIASGTVASAEAGIRIMSGGNIGEAILIAVTVGLVLGSLMIIGLVFWVRNRDAISDDTGHGEPN